MERGGTSFRPMEESLQRQGIFPPPSSIEKHLLFGFSRFFFLQGHCSFPSGGCTRRHEVKSLLFALLFRIRFWRTVTFSRRWRDRRARCYPPPMATPLRNVFRAAGSSLFWRPPKRRLILGRVFDRLPGPSDFPKGQRLRTSFHFLHNSQVFFPPPGAAGKFLRPPRRKGPSQLKEMPRFPSFLYRAPSSFNPTA